MFDDSVKMSEMGEAQGVRLETTGGIPTWEAFPNIRHQRKTDRIRESIRPAPGHVTDCSCVHYADIYIIAFSFIIVYCTFGTISGRTP
jgi:hypothetical protein